MKKLRTIFFMAFMVFGINTSNAINLDGKYISQSGELTFTFTNGCDSLYVDTANSGCVISSFKLRNKKSRRKSITFDAYEAYFDGDSTKCREVLIKVVKKKHKLYIEYYGKDKDRTYNTNEKYRIFKWKN